MLKVEKKKPSARRLSTPSTRVSAMLGTAAPGFALRWNKRSKVYELTALGVVVRSCVPCGYCERPVFKLDGVWSRCSACGAL